MKVALPLLLAMTANGVMIVAHDGEMKPHEVSNDLSQSVRGSVRYSKLHVHMTPPTGRVYNHRQLFLHHSWLWHIEYLCLSWPLGMTMNSIE